MSMNRKNNPKTQRKQTHSNLARKRLASPNPSSISLPLDLTVMPTMDELLEPTVKAKEKVIQSKPKPKSNSRNKNKRKPYRSALDFNNMPAMEMLLSETPIGDPVPPGHKEDSDVRPGKSTADNTDTNQSNFGNTDVDTMEALLLRANTEIDKKEVLTGTVCSVDGEKAIVDLSDGSDGVMFRSSLKKIHEWNALRDGSKVLVSLNVPMSENPTQKLTLIKILSRRESTRPVSRKASAKRCIAGCNFIIDGSNVCRSYMNLSGKSSLSPLMTLAYTLFKRQASCFCFFDASERYLLRRNAKELPGECVYERLLREFPKVFHEVSAGKNADDFILEMADRQGLAIISNDRFNKIEDRHLQLYPWLIVGNDRLIRGNVQHGMLTVEALGICVRLRMNLSSLLEDLRGLL